jgi:para-aminobenzoate synthetase/4-amino-4-deoxychorismate lyase
MTMFVRTDFPAGQGHPWLFEHPDDVIVAYRLHEISECLDKLIAATKSGKWVAGYLAYDAAPGLDANMVVHRSASSAPVPLLLFGVFSRGPSVIDTALAPRIYRLGEWVPDEDHTTYTGKIDQIREAIRAGLTYQTNYTFRMRTAFSGDPLAYYQALCDAQQASYSMYIETDSLAILSASPELFFALNQNHVLTRPMKGTAPRGRYLEEDNRLQQWLQNSEKNRAENIMITDLLRNDIGRIAVTGSVRTTALCEVERYPTVWQMTSTVEGDIPHRMDWTDVMRALFPSGSITGAPKLSTMKIIAGLESSPRSVYCGSLGYADPKGSAVFNVAIRTVVLDKRTGRAEFGTGGGVTWDSRPQEEYQESMTKSQFLTSHRPAFSLLETLRLENGVYWLLSYHMSRLLASAAYYGFPAVASDIMACLDTMAASHPTGPWKVRITVSPAGAIGTDATSISRVPMHAQAVAWAASPINASNPLIFHKTTARDLYDHHHPLPSDVFDHLLWNQDGEVTEFTRGNLVVWQDGHFWTPARDSGLLAGTLRAALLSHGVIQEKTITRQDLHGVRRAWFINSLHGWVALALPVLVKG